MTDRYEEWRDFYAEKVRSWMSLEELRAECGKLQTADATSPEVLLIHAMHALEVLQADVERLRTDGASAVRWAPGSAYWSRVLIELFGPDARKGIDVLEARWLKTRERANTAETLLRQALEALLGQRGEPDWHTGKQRETAIAALRERLGEGGSR
jgi:hypothetical protein